MKHYPLLLVTLSSIFFAACPAPMPVDAGSDVVSNDVVATDNTAPTDTISADNLTPSDVQRSDTQSPADVVSLDVLTNDIVNSDVITPGDTVSGDVAASCSMVGVWTVTFGGNAFYLRLTADGGLTLAVDPTLFDSNPTLRGTYTNPTGEFHITEDGSTGAGCPASQTGSYSVSFTPSCDAFTLTVIMDDCTSRVDSLDGATFAAMP